MPIALISVSNKEGIVEFAKKLSDFGYAIISTGGTFEVLKKAGLKNLKKVEEIAGFPEIMDGRVKTLHPKIFGGILADRSKQSHLKEAEVNQIPLIDLVICNLYPFDKEASIENIDIGGVSLLRAAAKNYQYVTVVCDPNDYQEVLLKLKTNQGIEFRKEMAEKAFNYTAQYDAMIADYFNGGKTLNHSANASGSGQVLNLHFEKLSDLRYGENPHQKAALFKMHDTCLAGRQARYTIQGIIDAEILHGKELSFNNILDADAALNLISEFIEPAAAVIKHTNPCGAATDKNINDAFKNAYQADALSAFGGVIVLNRPCTKEIAQEINKVFAEVVIAPDYEKEALEILKQKKNIRIIKIQDTNSKLQKISNNQITNKSQISKDYKRVRGGLLVQDYDDYQLKEKDLRVVTKKKPSKSQLSDLLFAWKVAKHVKSNAIVIAKNGITVGIGAGQMSRIESVEIALKKGQGKLKGAVVASDGFFPFKDSVDKLAEFGILSIIQPGGSVKDEEVISAANKHGISMAFTSVRAFRH